MRSSLRWYIIQIVLFWAIDSSNAPAEQVTVLFLGNSHTYFNDLPSLVQNLATAGGDTLLVDSNTPGGCTLAYPPNAHLYNEVSIGLLEAGGWDYVVLQEQSQIPVIPYIRDHYMYPGAIALDSIAHANTSCCLTTFFMTWGWEDGGQQSFGGYTSPDFADYDEMQDSVRTAYMRIADSLSTPVAPAGVAWQNAIHDGFPLSLFNPDGYHPSLAGSYLAACVFYTMFLQKSPLGLAFTGGLSEEHAAWLQAIADTTVLLHLQEWNISVAMPYQSFEFDWALTETSQQRSYPTTSQRHTMQEYPSRTGIGEFGSSTNHQLRCIDRTVGKYQVNEHRTRSIVPADARPPTACCRGVLR